VVVGPASLVGNRVAPLQSLGVEIVDIVEAAPREERSAHIADPAFHASFLVAAPDCHRPGLESIVPRELDEALVEDDRVAHPLDDGALEVVVEDDARDAAEPFN